MSSKSDQIILAARDLVFEQGLQDVTMSQIAQRAQVGMGTIYNYFPSKEDLVFCLFSEIKTAMSLHVLEGYDLTQPVVVTGSYTCWAAWFGTALSTRVNSSSRANWR